ncbi:MAG TPA: nucleotidyltransferase family protein [Candidatus Limnocylindria bacterium]
MSAPAKRVAAVVLAAGQGLRYGSQKLLAPVGDRPLLQHALDAANASSLSPVVVVLGADADAIEAGVRSGRARLVRNPDHATGQASSLRIGLRSLDASDAAVVVLGDQPNVTAALLDALVATQRSTGAPAVVCAQDGRRSPPTLLHRDLWMEVDALRGDTGARDVLARRGDVAVFDVAHDLAGLDDVDTQEDRERLSGG